MDKDIIGVYGQDLEKEGLEYLRKGMECINAIKVCLKDIEENDKNLDTFLKSILCENDYEYVKALMNGEEPKNNPIELEKIKVLKPHIAQIYMTNKAKENFMSIHGGLLKLVDDDLLNEVITKKLK